MKLARQLRTVTLILLTLLAGRALALEPKEVLVVANSNLDDSVALAKYYLKQREIPADNLLTVDVTRAYEMQRSDYNDKLLTPIRKTLVKRKLVGQIKCIVLMWGVPVRVTGEDINNSPIKTVYRRAKTRSHYRMATAQVLLATVGKEFPELKDTSLTPLTKLFDAKPKRFKTLPAPADLRKDIDRVILYKTRQLPRQGDKDKRSVMARQLMALQLDVFGLEGLIGYINSKEPVGAPDVDKLKKQLAAAKEKLKDLGEPESVKEAKIKTALLEIVSGAWGLYQFSQEHGTGKRPNPMTGPQKDAAVDSELAMMWHPNYPLKKFIANPLHWRMAKRLKGKKVPPTIMTARIDGPSASDAKRVIKDSVAVEAKGLSGRVYIDAGGKHPAWDRNLIALNNLLKSEKIDLPVVLDQKQSVFQRGQCPKAALYVGWYSLRKYIPAFQWQPGSVGYHIASFEAMHLRDPKSQEWCPQMIQNGVAATIGPVNEPYLGTFPLPQEFFPLLLTGEYTLAEAYWRTTPAASWRMTLIGDPLYNPFKTNPQLKTSDLPDDLAP